MGVGILLFNLLLGWAVQPLATDLAVAKSCVAHAKWVRHFTGLTGLTPRCERERRHRVEILRMGYDLCAKEHGGPRSADLCEPNFTEGRNLSAIRDVASATTEKIGSEALKEKYKELKLEIEEKNSICAFKSDSALLKALQKKLPGELPKEKAKGIFGGFLDFENTELPLKDIPPSLRMALSTVATSFLWRYRGGWLGPKKGGTTTRRAVTGVGMMAIGYFNGGLDGAIAGALTVPTMFAPYSKYWDLSDDNKNLGKNFAYMTGRGLYQTSLAGIYLAARGYGPGMLLSGAAMGPCYYMGWNQAKDVKLGSGKMIGAAPTQISEMCTGAAMGLGLSGSLLYGKSTDE